MLLARSVYSTELMREVDRFWRFVPFYPAVPTSAGDVLGLALESADEAARSRSDYGVAAGVHALLYEHDPVSARSILRDVSVNYPGAAEALRWEALAAATQGDFDAAADLLKASARAGGSYDMNRYYESFFAYLAGDYATVYQISNEIDATDGLDTGWIPSLMRGWAAAADGSLDDARDELLEAAYPGNAQSVLLPLRAEALACLGYVYALSGEASEARKIIRDLGITDAGRSASPLLSALVYHGLGESRKAAAMVQRAVEVGDPVVLWKRYDPLYRDLLAGL